MATAILLGGRFVDIPELRFQTAKPHSPHIKQSATKHLRYFVNQFAGEHNTYLNF